MNVWTSSSESCAALANACTEGSSWLNGRLRMWRPASRRPPAPDDACPLCACRATSTHGPSSCARSGRRSQPMSTSIDRSHSAPDAIDRMLEFLMKWVQWLEVEQRHLVDTRQALRLARHHDPLCRPHDGVASLGAGAGDRGRSSTAKASVRLPNRRPSRVMLAAFVLRFLRLSFDARRGQQITPVGGSISAIFWTAVTVRRRPEAKRVLPPENPMRGRERDAFLASGCEPRFARFAGSHPSSSHPSLQPPTALLVGGFPFLEPET